METILTSRSLNVMFDDYSTRVLGDYVSALPREKGKMRKYAVIAPLPTKEEYLVLKKNKYKTTVGDLISGAVGDLEYLKDELQEWFDNLPENFQQGDKGSQLEEAISNLEYISELDIPDEISSTETVHYPALKTSSRADRRDEAISMLETAKEVIEDMTDFEEGSTDKSELDEIHSSIEEIIDNAQNVEFPSMF